MAQKDIQPKKAFWMGFWSMGIVMLISLCVMIVCISDSISDAISKIFSVEGFSILMFAGAGTGLVFGYLMRCIQKEKKKEHVNELMREYLEKKLREEENK